MKFCLKSNVNGGRLGSITNIARLPDLEIQTPHVFLYTQGGTIPHLVHDVLEKVTTQKLGLILPMGDFAGLPERLKGSKYNIAKYIGMNEYFTYTTYINPGVKRRSGHHDKNKIALWTNNGRKTHSVTSYMEFMECLKPDMFLAMADGDTCSESSKKRTTKSFENSCVFFEQCMDFYNKSEALKTSMMLGAVEGGFNLELRRTSSKLIGESSVFGVVIDGLHDCSEKVSEMTTKDVKEVVEASLEHIPSNKLRIIHGCWNPMVMLDLIEMGIDIFDSTYPFYITEQGGALMFPNGEDIFELGNENGDKGVFQENQCLNGDASKLGVNENEEPLLKKQKLMTISKYHISLKDPVHVTDFTPIMKKCTCYTCQNHTRAYIHHLLNVNELLGPVLLTVHNLHHYLLYFSTIQKALQDGRFGEMKRCFKAWVDMLDNISTPS